MDSSSNVVSVDQWELCKENVQPLKKGRNFSSLTAALHDHNEHQHSLLAQRQQFEEELRCYKGDDPLSVWSRYISWTEQNYPTGGKESNLEQILHTCVSLFKDEKKYHNDSRYIQAWIRMANNYLDEPSSAYQFMHDHGIGSGLAVFYEAWSWNLEQAGNTKKADAVLNRGLECYAAPVDQLQKYHNEFQTRIIRGTMEDTMESMDSRTPEERTVLGGLKGRGKQHKVGTQRIGHVKKDTKGIQGIQTREPLASNQGFAVFCDTDGAAAPAVPDPTGQWETVPSRSIATKENVQKPSQWASHKVPQRGVSMAPPTSRPSIKVHVDEDADQIITPHKHTQMSHPVLSARKPEKKPNTLQYLNTFQSADDKTKVMYPKHLIYGGVLEMSLEELRAIRYKEKKKAKQLKEEQERIEQQRDELLRTKEALRLQQEELEMERRKFQEKMEQERLIQERKLHEQQQQQQQQLQQQLLQQQQEQLQQQQQQQLLLQQQQQQQLLQEEQERQLLQEEQERQLLQEEQERKRLQEQQEWQRLQEQQQQQLLQQQQRQQQLQEQQQLQRLQEQQQLQQQLQEQQQQKLLQQQQQQQLQEQQQQHLLQQQNESMRMIDQSNSKLVHPTSNNSSRRESDPISEFTVTKQLIFEDTRTLQTDLRNTSGQSASSAAATPSTNFSGVLSSIPQSKQKTPSLIQSSVKSKTPPTGVRHKTPGSSSSHKRSFLQPTPNSQSRSFHNLGHITPRITPKGIAAPSPTVNTKEALGCLMAMLSKPLDDDQFGWDGKETAFKEEDEMFEAQFANTEHGLTMNDDSNHGVVEDEFRKQSKPFAIYDETSVDGEQDVKKTSHFSIFEDQDNKAPVCIYEDKEEPVIQEKSHPPQRDDEEMKMIEGMEAIKLSSQLHNRSTSQDCTFAPHSSNPDFSAMARMVSTPFNSSEIPSFPVSHIKPSLMHVEMPRQTEEAGIDMETNAMTGDGVASASRLMAVNRESFEVAEETVNNPACNLSPIIEEHSSDCSSSSSQNKTTGASAALGSFQPQSLINTESSHIDMNVTRRRTGKSSSSSSNSSAPVEAPDVSHHMEEAPEEEAVFDASAMEDDCYVDELNPVSSGVVDNFLQNLEIPLTSYPGFTNSHETMPDIRPGITVYLGKDLFNIESCIGEGAFAKVYRAAMLDADDDSDLDGDGKKVVLKVQNPPCPWEFYICRQIAQRIQGLDTMVDVRPSIMNIDSAFVFEDGSILLNEPYYNGTLLNLVNLRNKNVIKVDESIVLYITIEILHIVDQLHRCGIIHGDIKPDNFLIRNSSPQTMQIDAKTPSVLGERTSGLKLIDMGCSIDMNLFPPGTIFRSRNGTSCFECTEMVTGKPWTYQTDLYGIAGTIHTLLFGSYMKVFQESGEWKITGSIKRHYKADWKKFFRTLLNVPNCNEIPSLSELCMEMEQVFRQRYLLFVGPQGVGEF